MEMDRAGYMVAEIRCQMREDCIHVYSDELPGFHLAVQADDQYSEADLCAAVEWYFKVTQNMNIRAERSVSPLELLGQSHKAQVRGCETSRVVMTPEFAVA